MANLGRVVHELRNAGAMSRSDVARRVGISLPTAHRLVSDLADLQLVEQESPESGSSRLGRPPVVYRFREDAALLAGIDIGNETTRLAVTTLAGRVVASQAVISEALGRDLAGILAGKISDAVGSAGLGLDHLAGVGAGVASAVDADGILRGPPIHKHWDGLALRGELAGQLGCDVAVAQDDHLSPIAESSAGGTFPGSSSLLVLEIGRGIGVGMTLGGVPVSGARNRFGRIAGWPVTNSAGTGHGTLGQYLVTGGLVSQYHEAGGSTGVRDGAALAAAARSGDSRAQQVFAWAAIQIADIVTRLHQLCDPQAVVLGGGMARAFDLLEPVMFPLLPTELKVARSVLGEQAVVTGAVLTAGSFVENWLHKRLARA